MRTLFMIINGGCLGWIISIAVINGDTTTVTLAITAMLSFIGYVIYIGKAFTKQINDLKLKTKIMKADFDYFIGRKPEK